MEGAGDWVVPVLAALFPARRRRGDQRREVVQCPCAGHRHSGMGAGTAHASKAVGPAQGSQAPLPGARPGGGRLSLLLWSCGRRPPVAPSDSVPCRPPATPAATRGLVKPSGANAGTRPALWPRAHPAASHWTGAVPFPRPPRGAVIAPCRQRAQPLRRRRSRGGAAGWLHGTSAALVCAARHGDGKRGSSPTPRGVEPSAHQPTAAQHPRLWQGRVLTNGGSRSLPSSLHSASHPQ